MTIEAKIFDITIHEKIAEVVERKKKKDKIFPICFIGFSKTIETIKQLGIQKTDKIKLGYTLQSKKYTDRNGVERYGTSAVIDWIELLEKNASTQTEVIFVEKETGEIIEDVDVADNSLSY